MRSKIRPTEFVRKTQICRFGQICTWVAHLEHFWQIFTTLAKHYHLDRYTKPWGVSGPSQCITVGGNKPENALKSPPVIGHRRICLLCQTCHNAQIYPLNVVCVSGFQVRCCSAGFDSFMPPRANSSQLQIDSVSLSMSSFLTSNRVMQYVTDNVPLDVTQKTPSTRKQNTQAFFEYSSIPLNYGTWTLEGAYHQKIRSDFFSTFLGLPSQMPFPFKPFLRPYLAWDLLHDPAPCFRFSACCETCAHYYAFTHLGISSIGFSSDANWFAW